MSEQIYLFSVSQILQFVIKITPLWEITLHMGSQSVTQAQRMLILEVVRDLIWPRFLTVSQLYTDFTFTVSPWQGRHHGFEGKGFCECSERKNFGPPPFAYLGGHET